jgi:hypothetical protein
MATPRTIEKTRKKVKHRYMKTYIKIALALVACTGLNAANPKPKLIAPTISCAGNTPASITLTITAGSPYGAPAGFSVQWMKQADLDALGGVWPSDETLFCKASFSGVPTCSQYNLGPGGTATVTISDSVFDACGATNHCETPLDCGTAYAFRAFAHANKTYDKSDFSATTTCSTAACGGGTSCTFTQGYWKNHPDVWPINAMFLGTVSYDQGDLLAIFGLPAAGNGLIQLAHQLIATKLNIANGADPTDISASVSAADALIGSLVVPPLGSGYLTFGATSSLIDALTKYNEGTTGPGHCP